MIFKETLENGQSCRGKNHFSTGGHIRGRFPQLEDILLSPPNLGGIVGKLDTPEKLSSGCNLLFTVTVNLVLET